MSGTSWKRAQKPEHVLERGTMSKNRFVTLRQSVSKNAIEPNNSIKFVFGCCCCSSQPIQNTNNRSGYFKSPSVYQMKCFIRRWKRFKYGLPESNSPLTFLKDFVRFVSFSHSLILHRKQKSIPRSIYIYRFLFVVNVNMSIEQIYGHQYTITRHSNHSMPIHMCVLIPYLSHVRQVLRCCIVLSFRNEMYAILLAPCGSYDETYGCLMAAEEWRSQIEHQLPK